MTAMQIVKMEPPSPEADWAAEEETSCIESLLDEEFALLTETGAHTPFSGIDVELFNGELQDLIKEEQLSEWFEEKTDIPSFNPSLVGAPQTFTNGLDLKSSQFQYVIPPVPAAPVYVQSYEKQQVVPSSSETSVLLQEFENVLSQGQDLLTPPDSPREEEVFYTILQDIQTTSEIDELVASRVENMYKEESTTPPYEVPSSGCSPYSQGSAAEDSWSCQGDSSNEDPDWIPSMATTPSPPPLVQKKKRGRPTPYSKSSGPLAADERKLRKKEQNKNAATRYRMKKKAEVENILDTEKDLKVTNDQLKNKVTDIQREIKYLKSLMRDVFRAKGLIK